jgi:hypothetical protein
MGVARPLRAISGPKSQETILTSTLRLSSFTKPVAQATIAIIGETTHDLTGSLK